MKEKLSFEAFYPDPPERVWRALTDPAALNRWLLPADFEPRIGFRFQFRSLDRGQGNTVDGIVLEVQEPRRLSYTWDDGEDDAPGVVCWTLKPTDGGTHLTLEHLPAEEPKPYVLIEASVNWNHALYVSLPLLLRLMRGEARKPPVPVVYVAEESETNEGPRRRAGFRLEEPTCRS